MRSTDALNAARPPNGHVQVLAGSGSSVRASPGAPSSNGRPRNARALVGALTGSRIVAIGVGLAVSVAGFLVSALAPLSDVLEPWRPFSPHFHYIGYDPLTNGLDPVHAGGACCPGRRARHRRSHRIRASRSASLAPRHGVPGGPQARTNNNV